MMTWEELTRALEVAHISRNELARRMRVDRRTVAKWQDDGEVASKYEEMVRRALAKDSGLGAYSDAALLFELGQRLERYKEKSRPDNDPPSGSRNFGERENVVNPPPSEGWQIGYGVAGQPEQ